ncbi:unnamed protein product [Adineta steineri]|uniref:G-protein coupled receptors family 1 profile domain-containing protein n=1 Tax=Adineta steineri TaxID=433720 RepID=A0A813YC69_9BILA|nr:unnamed protein product [Adineta steineri]CAF3842082.1 unnamed protein product [Adineta steineri]
MSNTTAINLYIANLNSLQNNILRYTYIIIFIAGNIGCFLNILIFTRQNYRQLSCSYYILASTFIDLILINFIILLRILNTFNIDPTQTSLIICKIRMYIAQAAGVLIRIFIVLACIDRWAMTSRVVKRRAFTNMKIPKILIPSVIIAYCLITMHVPFYQDIVNHRCIITSTNYTTFYNIFNAFISGLVIPMLMIIFSLLTVRNVRHLQQRVHARVQILVTTNVNEQTVQPQAINKKSYDYQLSFMILIQECVYIISNLPFVVYSFYIAITSSWSKPILQTTIETFSMNIIYALLYLNFSSTFYIYTIASHTFRKDLKQLLSYNRFRSILFGNRQNIEDVSFTQDQIRMRTRTATVNMP